MTEKAKKPVIDWDAIEKDWRAGIKTKLQMSGEYDVSRAAMDKRFKKLGIERDLGEKIRQKAESLVTQAAVTQMVTQERLVTTEREIIEVNAKMQADVILEHRTDIGRMRSICKSMVEELELQGLAKNELAKMAEVLVLSFTQEGEQPDPAEVNRQYKLLEKLLSLGGRVEVLKKLSDSIKNLIALEREAFGLNSDNPQTPGDALDNLLSALDGRTASLIPNK